MTTPKFSSIEDYLTSAGPAKAKTIRSVIAVILGEFPDLAAKIAWNQPVIHRGKKYVVGFFANKNHVTFLVWSPRVVDAFRARLAGHTAGKVSFHIPVDWDIDRELVRDLVRARLAEPEPD